MEIASPNYRFYRKPRFSANHIADYLCTTDPLQREAVIRRAKFPRKPNVIAYQQVVPTMRSFLVGSNHGISYFDNLIERLVAKTNKEEGYHRDEALRCLAAIEAFKLTIKKAKFGKISFGAGPRDISFKVEGVTINIRLDPPITEKSNDGTIYSGGCVIHLANSPEARKNIDERKKIVAAIIQWGLGEVKSNIEPLGRLCMSLDVFGGEVVKAPVIIRNPTKKGICLMPGGRKWLEWY